MKRIVLCGFMAAGKSFFIKNAMRSYEGVLEAEDLDLLVEKLGQKKVAQIFLELGESTFRKLEADSFFHWAQGPQFEGGGPKILALGGGSLETDAIFQWIKAEQKEGRLELCWIKTPWEECLRRIHEQAKDLPRPLANLEDSELFQLYQKRSLRYQTADYCFAGNEQGQVQFFSYLKEKLKGD